MCHFRTLGSFGFGVSYLVDGWCFLSWGEPKLERKLAAILAADVVGYSKLMTEAEELTLAQLKAHRADLFDPKIAEHNGRIIKLMGDGTLVEFASVVDAVNCAVAIQSALAEAGGSIRLRIGINLGDVIVDGDDIYGDGVNIAARLETLATTGGVCISSVVHESLGHRVEAQFIDAGEYEVKNIARPIRVFQWASDAALPIGESAAQSASDKPSIAVLAFDNMSDDPEQEYFSDGLTEDIITGLSRFSELFVIARNSSFAFKGKAIDIKEAARQLGVGYVVEGSVRKVGNRIRVTAQLIEAEAGAHIWADRYDRLLEDIFDVQDDVVRSIVAILPGRIAEATAERVRRAPTSNMSAFDYLQRGNHARMRRGASLPEAIDYFKKAIELDPQCAPAYAGVSLCECSSIWDLSIPDDNPLDRAYEFGKKAVEINPGDYKAHGAFGRVLRLRGSHDLACQHLQQALSLNPNSVELIEFWAYVETYTGNPQAGIDTYNRTIKLDPFRRDYVSREIIAESYYMMRRYADAIAALESMVKLSVPFIHLQIAMNYAQLGNMEKSEHHFKIHRAQLPENYDERKLVESHMRICVRQQDREHWLEGYRLVGLDV
jgi:TolB-like protein